MKSLLHTTIDVLQEKYIRTSLVQRLEDIVHGVTKKGEDGTTAIVIHAQVITRQIILPQHNMDSFYIDYISL